MEPNNLTGVDTAASFNIYTEGVCVLVSVFIGLWLFLPCFLFVAGSPSCLFLVQRALLLVSISSHQVVPRVWVCRLSLLFGVRFLCNPACLSVIGTSNFAM